MQPDVSWRRGDRNRTRAAAAQLLLIVVSLAAIGCHSTGCGFIIYPVSLAKRDVGSWRYVRVEPDGSVVFATEEGVRVLAPHGSAGGGTRVLDSSFAAQTATVRRRFSDRTWGPFAWREE